MHNERITWRLLLYEAIGFGVIITLSWLDELISLPALLFGNVRPGQPNWHEATLETAVILAAAIPTIWLTYRLIRRAVCLEGFLHVCAWCRKINADGQWMPMEEYFKTELNTKTSHGVCQECSEKFFNQTEKAMATF